MLSPVPIPIPIPVPAQPGKCWGGKTPTRSTHACCHPSRQLPEPPLVDRSSGSSPGAAPAHPRCSTRETVRRLERSPALGHARHHSAEASGPILTHFAEQKVSASVSKPAPAWEPCTGPGFPGCFLTNAHNKVIMEEIINVSVLREVFLLGVRGEPCHRVKRACAHRTY